ncbi:hypothetical protein P4O66_017480, partial [Electrophorus voltai]
TEISASEGRDGSRAQQVRDAIAVLGVSESPNWKLHHCGKDQVEDHIERAGHVCLLRDTRDVRCASDVAHLQRETALDGALAIHLYKAGRLLLDAGVPFGVVFGGTDINEDAKDEGKRAVMKEVLNRARFAVSFTKELKEKAEAILECGSGQICVQAQGIETRPSLDFSWMEFLRSADLCTVLNCPVETMRSCCQPFILQSQQDSGTSVVKHNAVDTWSLRRFQHHGGLNTGRQSEDPQPREEAIVNSQPQTTDFSEISLGGISVCLSSGLGCSRFLLKSRRVTGSSRRLVSTEPRTAVRAVPWERSWSFSFPGVCVDGVEDLKVFLLVCGLRRVKDPLYLLNAFSEWHTQNPLAILIIIGPKMDLEFSTEVQKCVERSAGVFLAAERSQEELHAAMQRSLAVVNSSQSEGMSAAVLEAMDLGVPVLARNIPGNAAIVRHGITGLLFSCPEEFVCLSKQLLHDKELRASLGRNGTRYVTQHHSAALERTTYQRLVATLH